MNKIGQEQMQYMAQGFSFIPLLQAQNLPPGRTRKRHGKKTGAKRHVNHIDIFTSFSFV